MTLKEALKARQNNGGSPIMNGREKLETIEIIEAGTVSLVACDIIKNDGDEFAVAVFAEFPDNFYFGGTVLTDIVNGIYEILDAPRDEPVYMLDDPIKMTATRQKTKKGNRMYTAFTIE